MLRDQTQFEERVRLSRLEAAKLLTTFDYGYALSLAVRASNMPFIVTSMSIDDYPIIYGSCPRTWCRNTDLGRAELFCQAARTGSLTRGLSLTTQRVSSVM